MRIRNGVGLAALVVTLAMACAPPQTPSRYAAKDRMVEVTQLALSQYLERKERTEDDYHTKTVRTKFKWPRSPFNPPPFCGYELSVPPETESIVDYWYTYDDGTLFSNGGYHECGGIALIPKRKNSQSEN